MQIVEFVKNGVNNMTSTLNECMYYIILIVVPFLKEVIIKSWYPIIFKDDSDLWSFGGLCFDI